jgi:hypothetical protein
MSILATVKLPSVTGLPKDDFVNTFAFQGDATSAPNRAAVLSALEDFYNFPARTTEDAGLAWHLARAVSRAAGGVEVKFYDIFDKLDGSPHGSPVGVGSFTLGPAHTGAAALPAEVAVVLTTRALGWQSALVEATTDVIPPALTSRPRQRHTGRVYIGPLNNLVVSESPTGVARVSNAFRDVLQNAASRLFNTTAQAGVAWSVWSRADEVLSSVDHVQVDDAFDTQRRRGHSPTVRETLDVTAPALAVAS